MEDKFIIIDGIKIYLDDHHGVFDRGLLRGYKFGLKTNKEVISLIKDSIRDCAIAEAINGRGWWIQTERQLNKALTKLKET